jgi:hypothetical protein
MPDLNGAFAVLRTLGRPMSPVIAASGTGWGPGNANLAGDVPAVPTVPAQMEAPQPTSGTACPHDILERAAILEFCEGLPRREADALALAEFGLPAGEDLVLLQVCTE